MWQPGQSGNPNGRPRVDPKLKAIAQAKTEEAMAAIIACLDDADPKVRIAAANAILDRGHGKPAQSVTVSGDEDNPLKAHIVVEYVTAAGGVPVS